MNGFVLYPHYTAFRSSVIPCSNRCSWAGQTIISHRTSQICGRPLIPLRKRSKSDDQPVFSTTKAIFNGGGGILGVGPSEIVVILAVGWFLLGPKKLYSLAKDTGRFLGELRRTADEARESLNEAIELDAIAAEIEEGKKLVQDISRPLSNDTSGKGKTRDKASDQLLAENMPVEDQLEQTEAKTESVVPAPDASAPTESGPTDSVPAESVPAVNSVFLEQLQRVADPDQKPPEDLPDIDVDMEEELEVRKLETKYLDARERLEKRRRKEAENKSTESEAIVEER